MENKIKLKYKSWKMSFPSFPHNFRIFPNFPTYIEDLEFFASIFLPALVHYHNRVSLVFSSFLAATINKSITQSLKFYYFVINRLLSAIGCRIILQTCGRVIRIRSSFISFQIIIRDIFNRIKSCSHG